VFLWRAAIPVFAGVPGLSVVVAPGARVIDLLDSLLYILYLGWALWGFHRRELKWLPVRIVAALLGVVITSGLVSAALALVGRMRVS